MKITKAKVIKEPWLRAFMENVNVDKTVSDDEETEINQIRERMSSPILRCEILKDCDLGVKGDFVGIREIDVQDFIKNKSIIIK